MAKSPEIGPREEQEPAGKRDYAAEAMASLERQQQILKRRSEAFEQEKARLQEIVGIRPLTDEEKNNLAKLARMGPLPEEKE